MSLAVFLTTFFIDTANLDVSIRELLHSPGAANMMTSMPEVIAGLLGITISVVAIIVELAANRYTPHVTELFIKSPVNTIVLGFFVVTGTLCIWVSLAGSAGRYVPKMGVTVSMAAVTCSLLILIPYFIYVFNFLNPHHIINRMHDVTLKAIQTRVAASPQQVGHTKRRTLRGIEQLADIALNAIDHKDKGICMHAAVSLGDLSRDYLGLKGNLPDIWFEMETVLCDNADFVSFETVVIEAIEKKRTWVEMKVLRQYQMLYGETLNKMRDINYIIAIHTRKLAEKALIAGDPSSAELAQKFFNTYLRATINQRDVRTAYNVLNQYRLLAEFALEQGQWHLAVEIAERFKYYGQLGFSQGMAFVLETAAYDLCRVNELAFDLDVPCRDQMLAIFLEVDKKAEADHAMEASLRGVRKAQVKLATYYLTHSQVDLARIIFQDMEGELTDRLESIHSELASIIQPDFWEITDRGTNLDYLEPKRREQLDVFFGWFKERSQGA
ncbi:MAG: DUF2254 domain-containing protein [Phycisphaerae bacterium]|nr:DUF2254 domain-containing protein [Phycisphaerae bacterium]